MIGVKGINLIGSQTQIVFSKSWITIVSIQSWTSRGFWFWTMDLFRSTTPQLNCCKIPTHVYYPMANYAGLVSRLYIDKISTGTNLWSSNSV
ncbi:unnamed protein product [Allacma fusca]|uniref:Uncharacterized protein n=1 Tax=Allacma fusca TaxID=39272 RepID=A0A8J2L241_9HEXA|nr:unnamed protein product [Allacma fusca]